MAWRDRTSLFMRLRGEAKAFDQARRMASTRQGSKSRKHGSNIYERVSSAGESKDPYVLFEDDDIEINDMSLSVDSGRRDSTRFNKPEWIQICEQLRNDMKYIREQMEHLKELHKIHLLPGFGEETKREEEEQINKLSMHITQKLREGENSVKRIAFLGTENVRPGEVPPPADTVQTTIQQSFASQLQKLSLQFRLAQKDYLRQLQGQNAIVGSLDDEDKMEITVLLDDTAGSHDDAGFTTMQILQAESSQHLIEERAREIDAVAASINDLAYLMRDLGHLVMEQGTILDRIDYNIEAVKDTTQVAVKELVRAERQQRKRRSVACILCLTIACGIMAIILILKWLF